MSYQDQPIKMRQVINKLRQLVIRQVNFPKGKPLDR